MKSEKFTSICDTATNAGQCRKGCPLVEPCKNVPALEYEAFVANMNDHAELIEVVDLISGGSDE